MPEGLQVASPRRLLERQIWSSGMKPDVGFIDAEAGAEAMQEEA